jgi:hypothetical protein
MASSQPASNRPFWPQKEDPSGLGAAHVFTYMDPRQRSFKIDETGALINHEGDDSSVGAVEDSAHLSIGSSRDR